MTPDERAARSVRDARRLFAQMAELVARGRRAYDDDIAVRLAIERTAESIGEVAKRLMTQQPERFADPQWRLVARHRDLLAHHYDDVDPEMVWRIAESRMPALAAILEEAARDMQA